MFQIGQIQAEDVMAASPLEYFEGTAYQLKFRYPTRFQIGRYSEEHDITGHFRKQIVLVEPKELRGDFLDAIPVGKIPTISIGHETGQRADFLMRFTDIALVKRFFSVEISEKEFERVLGGRKAYRLPGYPGPHGDQAHYYLVPLSQDRVLQITAHKYYFNRKKDPTSGLYPQTSYDKVIETIIETIELTEDIPLNKPIQPTR